MEHRTGKLRVVMMAAASIFAVGVPWIGRAEDASQTKVPSSKSVAEQIDQLCAEWDKPDSPGLSIAVARDATGIYARTVGSANLDLSTRITTEAVFQVASVSQQFTA